VVVMERLTDVIAVVLLALMGLALLPLPVLLVVAVVLEVMAFREVVNHSLQVLLIELQHLAAADADHVLVVAAAEDVLIVEVLITEVELAHKAGVNEQFEGPVDRGDGDS